MPRGMAARIGWTRKGSRKRFRYFDADGREITDESKLERIASLAIPPAWKDVWISSSARSKLQATGVDAAGRKQYLYHPAYRARQEQAKYDRLIRFAERLPRLREAMADHMQLEGLPAEKVAAIAVRLINLGWFRVGGDLTAKDFRTWGGTLIAAIEFAQQEPPKNPTDAKRRIAAVMRKVGEALGNTAAVARSSYVSPAVVEQYLDGRTVEDFRPRHLRVVRARGIELDPEEQALLSLLRSWRIRRARAAA